MSTSLQQAPAQAPVASSWPNGTYKPNYESFDEFVSENFVSGTPTFFTKKEVKKALLVYTPEKEKEVSVSYGDFATSVEASAKIRDALIQVYVNV